MNTKIKILLWILSILFLNIFGRYLYIVFSTGGYSWIKHFYIVIAGAIAALIAIIIFFVANYFINKKRKELKLFSFTKTRLLIMFSSIILAYIGEKIYLFLSDYFLFN